SAGLVTQRWLKTHPTTQPPAHVAAPPTTLPERHTDFKTTVAPTHDHPTVVTPPVVKRPHPPAAAHDKTPVVVAETAPPRTFELSPNPKAVSVSLDGKLLGDYGPQLKQLQIPAGRHTVRFESPYCFPKDVEIADNEPAGRLAARLRFKP